MGLLACEMHGFVDNMGVQQAANAHPGFTDPVLNISSLSVDNVVCGNELSENDQRQMVQNEWKSTLLNKDIVDKTFQASATSVGIICGHFFYSKGVPFLSKHWRFLECSDNVSCLQSLEFRTKPCAGFCSSASKRQV